MTRRIIVIFFSLVLIASWIVHVSFRNDHFQEVDSSGTYAMLYAFPQSAIKFTAISYPQGHILSSTTAEKILNYTPITKIRTEYFSQYSEQFLVDKLMNISPVAAFRLGLIQLISRAHLPFAIQSFFAIGLGSTYSPGTGLVYGLISSSHASYDTFMSRSMIVTITLFSLSILLLFLILEELGIDIFISIGTCLIALFSISLYSAGIEIGSTGWNIVTELFWIWYIIRHVHDVKLNRKIAWLTGILVFFNYLIILFWGAFLIQEFIADQVKEQTAAKARVRSIWKWVLNAVKAQWPAIVLVGVCGFFFYPPGQGFRGSVSLHQFPSYSYYITLNFISWYVHSSLVNVIQFIIGLVLIAGVIRYIVKTETEGESSHVWLRNTFGILIAVYFAFVLLKILSFAPTRHVLFLAPVFFIGSAAGLSAVFKKYTQKIPIYISLILFILAAATGFWCISLRNPDVYDRTKALQIDPDAAFVGVYDASYNILYQHASSTIPVMFINPNDFAANGTYEYVSQSTPFNEALADWDTQYDIQVKILSETDDVNPTYFIAYNPYFKQLSYSRPNSLYQVVFKVISITKKQ